VSQFEKESCRDGFFLKKKKKKEKKEKKKKRKSPNTGGKPVYAHCGSRPGGHRLSESAGWKGIRH
jgi:hypothetical protein